jgi:hypothetical protein
MRQDLTRMNNRNVLESRFSDFGRLKLGDAGRICAKVSHYV